MSMTILHPKVRVILEILDAQFQQEGQPTYQALEEARAAAEETGDGAVEGESALAMGIRLLSMITVARALTGQEQTEDLPAVADILEPAVDLFARALEIAIRDGNLDQERWSTSRLADSYFQAGQFQKALGYFERTIDLCDMHQDAALLFDVFQKTGDCYFELGEYSAALTWHHKALDVAEKMGDPLEVHVQHGKIACALSNLKHYDEALEYFVRARDLLVALSNDQELQSQVLIHKSVFNASTSAMPDLIAYADQRISEEYESIGRDLLRELPERIAQATRAVLTGSDRPDPNDWPVFRQLELAVHVGAMVLRNLLNDQHDTYGTDPDSAAGASASEAAGALARQCFGEDMVDPPDNISAARLLMQVDRSRRAALHVETAEASLAAPGPFGGGNSRSVVYLRSFVAGPRLPRFSVEPWGAVGIEELFACMLDRSPLLALGDPDFERYGPGSASTSDENWRDVLRALAMEAQMLLVIPSPTAGTSWEIEWVTVNKFLHKTCFVMPPPGAGEEAWWTENWNTLREWAVRLGLNLPKYSPEGSVFRLTSEGTIDQIEFGEIYASDDLHMTLLTRLLFQPNLSFDFLFGLQQQLEHDRQSGGDNALNRSVSEVARAIGADDTAVTYLPILFEIERGRRFEFSNWAFDEPQVPSAPAVLFLYEGPFRLLWAEQVDDLHDVLTHYATGKTSDFTRALFRFRISKVLGPAEVEQLLEGRLDIESVVSFRIKQLISYRFHVEHDGDARDRLIGLARNGAAKQGAPEFVLST